MHYHVFVNFPGCLPEGPFTAATREAALDIANEEADALRDMGFVREQGDLEAFGLLYLSVPDGYPVRAVEIAECAEAECEFDCWDEDDDYEGDEPEALEWVA
jgi:hypothetical protein